MPRRSVRFDLIIFDNDGVLVDSEPIACDVMAGLLSECGLPTTFEDVVRDYLGGSISRTRKMAEAKLGRSLRPDFQQRFHRGLFERFPSELKPATGIEEVLDRLDELDRRFCVAASGTHGEESTVSGGHGNNAGGRRSAIGGGLGNMATDENTTVGGGHQNEATEETATVGGGFSNIAGGLWATVGGGSENSATGQNSTVPGGIGNQAVGLNSFAAGKGAIAGHGGFVWADSPVGGAGAFRVERDEPVPDPR